jgi:hypothetical protein
MEALPSHQFIGVSITPQGPGKTNLIAEKASMRWTPVWMKWSHTKKFAKMNSFGVSVKYGLYTCRGKCGV